MPVNYNASKDAPGKGSFIVITAITVAYTIPYVPPLDPETPRFTQPTSRALFSLLLLLLFLFPPIFLASTTTRHIASPAIYSFVLSQPQPPADITFLSIIPQSLRSPCLPHMRTIAWRPHEATWAKLSLNPAELDAPQKPTLHVGFPPPSPPSPRAGSLAELGEHL